MDESIKMIPPAQNDRIMAALAHATVILPMTGIIAWILVRVAFVVEQAVLFDPMEI